MRAGDNEGRQDVHNNRADDRRAYKNKEEGLEKGKLLTREGVEVSIDMNEY